jgi:hypothetical protein
MSAKRSDRLQSPALKRLVRQKAAKLLSGAAVGFDFREIASELGAEYQRGGAEWRRLEHQLNALVKAGHLLRGGNGQMTPGLNFALLTTPNLQDGVFEAIRHSGGVATIREIRAHCGLAEGDEAPIRDIMNSSGRVFRGIPLPGFQNHWFFNDAERSRIPLAGFRQLLELRILRFRQGVLGNVGLLAALRSMQIRIGLCLRDARELFGKGIADVALDPAFKKVIASKLEAATGARLPDATLSTQYASVADWWKDLVRGEGEERGVCIAWKSIEGDAETPPLIQHIVDVACWDAIGGVFNLDAGLLSRGALLLPGSAK